MIRAILLTIVTAALAILFFKLMRDENEWALGVAVLYSTTVFVTMAEWADYYNDRRE